MNTVLLILTASILLCIGLMLLRVFHGPTAYDRMNGLGVIGADTILLLVIFGYMDGRVEMYLDMAVSYAMLGFLGSVIIAKLLGKGKI